jgi:hypothetical protein
LDSEEKQFQDVRVMKLQYINGSVISAFLENEMSDLFTGSHPLMMGLYNAFDLIELKTTFESMISQSVSVSWYFYSRQ